MKKRNILGILLFGLCIFTLASCDLSIDYLFPTTSDSSESNSSESNSSESTDENNNIDSTTSSLSKWERFEEQREKFFDIWGVKVYILMLEEDKSIDITKKANASKIFAPCVLSRYRYSNFKSESLIEDVVNYVAEFSCYIPGLPDEIEVLKWYEYKEQYHTLETMGEVTEVKNFYYHEGDDIDDIYCAGERGGRLLCIRYRKIN